MKVSIVTVVYNGSLSIRTAIESVLNQTYGDIEYIVVDGASTDGTIDIVKSYGDRIHKFISEPDKGIYNAMNKGIRLASGEIVGILNSDDFFTRSDVIERVVNSFSNDIDAIFGDIQFVKPNKLDKIVRYYSSKHFSLKRFRFGFMPAHPSFYTRRHFFNEFGYYKEEYRIGADFELLLRYLFDYKLRYKYLSFPFVTMRTGGISNRNMKSNIILNKEILKACKENNLRTNLLFIYLKYFIKVFEYFGTLKSFFKAN
ncbi:MAG: glycosyltransferase family 2 protein [Bacteroidales bacterium]